MDAVRTFAAPKFFLSVFLVTALCVLCSWKDLSLAFFRNNRTDVTYIFSMMMALGAFKNMILLAAAFPGAGSFCSDWNHQFIRPVCIRCGVRKYSHSKVVFCAGSVFLTVFLGMLLYVFLLVAFRIPLLGENGKGVVDPLYGPLLTGDFPLLYFLVKIFLLSVASAFWGIVGLLISSWIPNYFVAVSAPFISYYLLGEFGEYLPDFMNFRMLAYGYDVVSQGIGVTMLYTVLFFGLFSFIVGKLFQRNMQRRVANELF